MIITNVETSDLESILAIQESVFQEEPLLTGLDYFNQVTSIKDLEKCFEKYERKDIMLNTFHFAYSI